MSTVEKAKKPSKSPKSEDKKNKIDVDEVHTANDWEHADLGDEQRKQKFLRLMGAKKRKDESQLNRQDSLEKQQDDDVSPEKKHCRSKAEDETINRELEKQFNEGLQSKLQHKHHGGLGFHEDTTTTSNNASNSADWQHESVKGNFVPATTKPELSKEQVKIEDQSKDKKEKKKKSKS